MPLFLLSITIYTSCNQENPKGGGKVNSLSFKIKSLAKHYIADTNQDLYIQLF